MSREEFIGELKTLGFKDYTYNDTATSEEQLKDDNFIMGFMWSIFWDFEGFKKDDIKVFTSFNHGIDEDGYLIPYRLIVNEKLVIGHKRALKYINELLDV